MVQLAAGARQQLQFVAESTRGTTPASPTMKKLRFNTTNLNLKNEYFESDEVRSDRLVADGRMGMNEASGDIVAEVSIGTFDDLLLAAFGASAWSAPTTGSTSLAGVAQGSGNQITRAAGSFVTDGFLPNDIVSSAGFVQSANNKAAIRIKVVAATALTFFSATEDPVFGVNLATDASAAGRTVALVGKRTIQGTTLTTFSIEQGFLDIPKYRVFRGCSINAWTLEAKTKQIMKQTFTILGMSASPSSGATVAGGQTAAATNAPMDAFLGLAFENLAQTLVVTGMTVKLENGFTLDGIIGSDISPDVFNGRSKITGQVTVFLPDLALYDKFYNETTTSLFLTLRDLNGTDFFNITLPKVKLKTADTAPPKEGPIVMTLDYQALADPVSGSCIYLQRSNTP